MTEILIVIGILSLLTALLFPVFASMRAKGREQTCLSNLHQIGLAVGAYASDYDDNLPWGCDPLDKTGIGWSQSGLGETVKEMSLLPDMLNATVRDKSIWHCPADTGFKVAGISEEVAFEASPSSYDQYQTSYYAQTLFAVHHDTLSTFKGYDLIAPHDERFTSDTIYLYDASGRWHGTSGTNGRRYSFLFLDGHVKSAFYDEFLRGINVVPEKPAAE